MKKLLVLLVLLCSFAYSRTSVEFALGSITSHIPYDFIYHGSANGFKNKIDPSGFVIFNLLTGMKVTVETNELYYSARFFFGENSTGIPMGGFDCALGFHFLKQHLYVGLLGGGYVQSAPKTLLPIDNNNNFVPLLGIECNIKLNLGKYCFIKFNNVFTLLVINNSMSFGVYL